MHLIRAPTEAAGGARRVRAGTCAFRSCASLSRAIFLSQCMVGRLCRPGAAQRLEHLVTARAPQEHNMTRLAHGGALTHAADRTSRHGSCWPARFLCGRRCCSAVRVSWVSQVRARAGGTASRAGAGSGSSPSSFEFLPYVCANCANIIAQKKKRPHTRRTGPCRCCGAPTVRASRWRSPSPPRPHSRTTRRGSMTKRQHGSELAEVWFFFFWGACSKETTDV